MADTAKACNSVFEGVLKVIREFVLERTQRTTQSAPGSIETFKPAKASRTSPKFAGSIAVRPAYASKFPFPKGVAGGERTGDQKEGVKICISISNMTFTRKIGPKRPVENEATVEVEVTRPKRNVKKPIAAVDLPETSQRRGKKRVHEVSPGSPPKRRKPAVQPPPKPAPSKARPKVKAPKRVKRERAESVEAVAVEAVEKERSSEGPWLIGRYYKVDVVSKVQWAYMKPEDICDAFAEIFEFHQTRFGLKGVITRQYVPPNVPLCKEWLLSFDGGPQRDCSATVQGQRIVLTDEMIRDAFFIPEELNPGASSHSFPKHVMWSALEDWFSRYDEKAKRYLVEDCVHEEWRFVFQCL
ncbi:hypothetical protein R1sor_010396 [Riccia sorocarpa]|uniref:Uncharacterized protein n=1 Tax=Riccia sorocarpa TaxID=122646 RepID=A0ABD3I1U5_9MARC